MRKHSRRSLNPDLPTSVHDACEHEDVEAPQVDGTSRRLVHLADDRFFFFFFAGLRALPDALPPAAPFEAAFVDAFFNDFFPLELFFVVAAASFPDVFVGVAPVAFFVPPELFADAPLAPLLPTATDRTLSTAFLMGRSPRAAELPTIAPAAPPKSAPTGPPTIPPTTAPVIPPAVCFETEGRFSLVLAFLAMGSLKVKSRKLLDTI